MMKTRITTLLLLLAAIAAFPAFAEDDQNPPMVPAAPPAAAALTPTSSDAAIGPRDRLEIKVFEDPTQNTTVTVSDDGKITLGLLGKIDVSGLTPTQVEQRLKQLFEARFLSKATVSVQVTDAVNKPISVVGVVRSPGRINATGNIRLIQAITQAGGLAAGYGKELYVLRTGQNGLTERISIDVDDLLVNGNPDLNLPLLPNDVVNVPADTPITIYVLGEVMHPGTVTFRRSQAPMLLQALAGAGGPTDRASKTIYVKRRINGEEKTITANYKKIVEGKSPDMPLMDNDTVFLKESVF